MLDRRVINVAGILIDEKVVQAFGGCLHGALIRPGDESYDRSRSVWNGMIDRHPSMIVFCTDVDDVIRSVQFARAYELLVSIRSGGHNVAGNSVCDGGIVIDLSRMKRIVVNASAFTARAQAGLNWGELDRSTQTFSLATTGGSSHGRE